MSRGYGRTQRAVLAVFALGGSGTRKAVVSAIVGGREPTRAEYVSISRALRTLASGGAIEEVDGVYRLANRGESG